MRLRQSMAPWIGLGLSVLVCAAPVARAEIERADPLRVPAGPLPEPGAAPDARARLAPAAEILREHGHDDLPVLAWALLGSGDADPAAVEEALGLAPGSPGVLFEAARQGGGPGVGLRALAALAGSLPGLLWLATALGGALGAALLAASALLIAISFARALALHGHALAHPLISRDPPAWPGALLLLAALVVLPRFGVGAVAVLGLAGALAALRLPQREAVAAGMAVAVLGLCAGPGADTWARFAIASGRQPALTSAWRVERGQGLPSDRVRLEHFLKREPTAAAARIALATWWTRHGDLARAGRVLGDPDDQRSAATRAAAHNLRGIHHIALGEVGEAIRDLEVATRARPSAATWFNLSQAYGRALRLIDQKPAFNQARRLDPALVEGHAAETDTNLHHYLIREPLPLAEYLREAWAPRAESGVLVDVLRERLLGAVAPWYAWMLLPLAGLAGIALRRGTLLRCNRCDKLICGRCSAEAAAAGTCLRCVSLFMRRENVDSRVRQQELVRDRLRQRAVAFQVALTGLLVPGAAALWEGQPLRGFTHFGVASLGVALYLAPRFLVAPWELGALGDALCAGAGLFLVVAAWLVAAVRSLRKLGEARALT